MLNSRVSRRPGLHCGNWDFVFLAVMAGAWCLCPASEAAKRRGGEAEYRTVSTDVYEIVVEKNGHIDIEWISDEPVFDEAMPKVLFEGKDEAEPLRVRADNSSRIQVNDPLGTGQGMILAGKDAEWCLRAYPMKPILTAQVVYTNDSKAPVRIAKLIPWSVGTRGKGAFELDRRAQSVFLLENGRLFEEGSDFARVTRDSASSQWNLAAYSPDTGREVVAGFLTSERAYTRVVVDRGENPRAGAFDLLEAECIYDPPVTVAPGERLSSELLYLSFSSGAPHLELERYAKAVAVVNGVRDRRPFVPHGWDSWSTHYGKDITEDVMRGNMAVMDAELRRYGWDCFSIDDGWSVHDARWEADPVRFPSGMKAIADEAHARKLSAGLWVNPFTVPRDSALAAEHPDWMAEPNARGKALMGEDDLILDVTVPEAYAYARDLASKITRTWGYDALMEADFVYHLMLAEGYHNPAMTRVEVMRLGMQALREGMREDAFLMTVTPQMITGCYAEGMRVGVDCAPVWRGTAEGGPWGCVETLTNAIRRYYFTPHFFLADQDCAFFGHESSRERWKVTDRPALTPSQSLAWLTGAALTGGVVKIGEPFSELSPGELSVLRKLLPSVGRPARPIDLFQEDSPRIWFLPLESKAGTWNILALFNWNENEAETVSVSFDALGLASRGYYTVYEFWSSKYCGTAEERLDVSVPAGSVLLFGLRRYVERPMLLATDRHFTQGVMDHRLVEWDAGARQLRGRFEGVSDTTYTLRVLAHDPYVFAEAWTSAGAATAVREGNVIAMTFLCAENGPVDWRMQF